MKSSKLEDPKAILSTTKTLGRLGEAIAARHLRRLGWQIITQNWSCKQGEIDIIGRDGKTVVFVEVRTRRGKNALDLALESVGAKKQQRLARLVELYQIQHLPPGTPVRIDVVGVAVGSDGLIEVEMVKDAYTG